MTGEPATSVTRTVQRVDSASIPLLGGRRVVVRAFRSEAGELQSVTISRGWSEAEQLAGVSGGDVSIPADALGNLVSVLGAIAEA